MYSQSFLVNSVRGRGLEPTIAARASSGWTGFMKAAFGLRFVVDLESAIPALEATHLGNQHLFAGSSPGLGRPKER